ncbi:hypothetical protein G7054_g4716 [Neopestalotiopsis clavispora]|nr:hypothetical protein G7054_g4716 [Neopestalotiopsis clavispora]
MDRLLEELHDVRVELGKKEAGPGGSIDRLQRELHETRAELGQKEAEISKMRAQWRRAVSELNKLKVRGQVVCQATDQEIVDKVEQLRYAVRDFAFQHFEAELPEKQIQDAFETMQSSNQLCLPNHRLHDYLTSPLRRTLLIRSYIWIVLLENVAGLYYWCGRRTSKAMRAMEALLSPDDDSSPSNEEIRKWNNWRVETTRLIWDAKNGKIRAMNISRTRLFMDLISAVYSPLRSLTKTPELNLRQHLSIIMRQFLDLDRILTMQVAEYDWEGGSLEKRDRFTESTMVLEPSESLQNQPQRIALILAPGLVKFGNSYGTNYDQSMQLLKMEVSCQIARRRKARKKPPKQGGFRGFWKKLCN